MRHSYFEISNFKGIGHIRLDFEAHPRSNVYTLVGLNESGKTTILEALNFLSYKIETLDPLDLPGYSTKSVYDLIPINKRSNFNEKIIIKVEYILNSDDEAKIKKFCADEFAFQLTQKIETITITQSYGFKDSELISDRPNNLFNIDLVGRSKRGRKEKPLEAENKLRAFQYVKKMLPSILYFPNFLFEFPDKIYLEDPSTDIKKHEFYRTILQDVLDAIGEKTNIETHILNRAKDGTLHSRRALESVLLKMGSHISDTVFSNWNRIFKRSSGNKEIVVNYEKDDDDLLFLQLRIKDGSELYTISERSLGFRWFFAFLLLTQYRGFRKEAPHNVLFLLDEPASNLHSSAQAQLLKSFGNFPESCSIIYTTHSHHLINSDWLEGTFVVKNEGLDYNDEDNYKAKDTIVTLNKYRDFVARHPDQTTYFQPILDVLDYSPSQLENIPNVVIVEGKNDFYTLKYFKAKSTLWRV